MVQDPLAVQGAPHALKGHSVRHGNHPRFFVALPSYPLRSRLGGVGFQIVQHLPPKVVALSLSLYCRRQQVR